MTSDEVRIIRRMLDDFQKVMRRLVGVGGAQSLSGIDALVLFETPGDDDTARLARANGTFLLSLCGGSEAVAATAVLEDQALRRRSSAGRWQDGLRAGRLRRWPREAAGALRGRLV